MSQLENEEESLDFMRLMALKKAALASDSQILRDLQNLGDKKVSTCCRSVKHNPPYLFSHMIILDKHFHGILFLRNQDSSARLPHHNLLSAAILRLCAPGLTAPLSPIETCDSQYGH